MKEEIQNIVIKKENLIKNEYGDSQKVKGSKKRKKRNHRKITRSQFLEVMHLSQKEAAEKLDVCISTLKKQFSTLRPKIRWPTPNEQRTRIHFLKLKNMLEDIIDENDMISHNVPKACRERWRNWKNKEASKKQIGDKIRGTEYNNGDSGPKIDDYSTIRATIGAINVKESEVYELREHPEHSKREMQYMMKIAYYQKLRIEEESKRSHHSNPSRSLTPTHLSNSTSFSNLENIHSSHAINNMIQNHMRFQLQDPNSNMLPLNLIFQHLQQDGTQFNQLFQPTSEKWLNQQYTVDMQTMEIISGVGSYTYFSDLFSAQLFPTSYYSKIFNTMESKGWKLVNWYDYQKNALVEVIVNFAGNDRMMVCIKPKCPRNIKYLQIGIDHSYHSFKPPRYKFNLGDQYFTFTDSKKVSLDYEWHHMSVFDTFEHKIKENFKVQTQGPMTVMKEEKKCPFSHTNTIQPTAPQSIPSTMNFSRLSISPSEDTLPNAPTGCPFHLQQQLNSNIMSPLQHPLPLQSLSPPPPSSSLSPNGSIISPLGIMNNFV
mmetsp:Transcript_14132/g.21378  ORF Transcript_14132/g.21378 Transcript_14132/m.21378 type:complete len:543 (-) Transcript_14132:34-1662(-)